MEHRITIARPAAAVFAYLADPGHLRDWLPHLRRAETPLPDAGLEVDAPGQTIRWSFPPAGEWRVEEADGVTTLTLALQRNAAPPADPTEAESPREAATHSAMAALHSLKSHLEGVGGGDPDLPADPVPSTLLGRTATQDPDI